MKKVLIIPFMCLCGLMTVAFTPADKDRQEVYELSGSTKELNEVSSFTKFEERATHPDKSVWAHRVETWHIGGNKSANLTSDILEKY